MKHFFISSLICFCTFCLPAQERAPSRIAEQIPYPFKSVNFVGSIFDRTMYPENNFFNKYSFRAITTALGIYYFKANLPLAQTNITAGGKQSFGLGDADIRFAHIIARKNRIYLAYSLNMVMPTASSIYLGAGKWQLHPGMNIAYFKPQFKGTYYLSTEYRFSFAGDDTRSHISVLAISPNTDWWFKRWSIGYYGTWTYDFASNIFDLPIDIEGGYHLKPNKLFLSGEVIIPLLKQATYNSEFAIKLRLTF